MLEPSSLYAKIKITKENLKKFLLSKVKSHTITPTWAEWWESRQMEGKMPLTDKMLSDQDGRVYEFLKTWHEYAESYTETKYDLQTETWHLSIYFFTENYYAMLNTLAVLADIAEYRDGNSNDFIVVYPFHWGEVQRTPDRINAYLKFNGNKSEFVLGEVSQTDFDTANKYLNTRCKALNVMQNNP